MLDNVTRLVGPTVVQRKLSERAVQRKEVGQGSDGGEDVRATAEEGVAGGGGSLPHLDAIQRSFGRHQIGDVQAHSGGAAATASRAMGADAYATGNRVAFANAPDLHTAAHEAAHVVQQRAGVNVKHGVGEAGDPYEKHADAVADKVVQGQSAEAILDEMVRGGGGGGTAVQHKNTIVDDKTDKTNKTSPGQGRGNLKENSGTVNTRVTFGGLVNGCATSMDAVLHPSFDDLTGTKVDDWPPWWSAVAPTGSFWVQGHLLNHNLGGPGEARNLTPITKRANSRHNAWVEEIAKGAARTGKMIDYKVLPTYTSTGPALANDPTNPKKAAWPKITTGFTCTLSVIDPKTAEIKGPFKTWIPNER